MRHLQSFCLKLQGQLEGFYYQKISPLGIFGNYLLVGLVLGISAMLLFVKLAGKLLENELKWFDDAVIGIIYTIDSPLTTAVMKGITNLGSPTVMIVIALTASIILWQVKRHFWDATILPIALIGSSALNELLKWIFQRDRPDIARLIEATGYSFPSGHAMASITLYGLLAYLVWLNMRDRPLRFFLTLTLALLVAAIGTSRIYLGVHYPSDVLAGYAAGSCWLVGCILGLQAIRYYKSGGGSI